MQISHRRRAGITPASFEVRSDPGASFTQVFLLGSAVRRGEIAVNPPPLLVSFPNFDELREAVGKGHLRDSLASVEGLILREFPPIHDVPLLAVMFGYSLGFVQALRKRPWKYYRSFTITTGAKQRRIFAPRVALKVIQAWIGCHLARAVKLGRNVHGFVPGKSTLTAASQHCGSNWLVTADIRDFFPSTKRQRIEAALVELGYSPSAADLIADLCVLGDELPQGSPASPVLSNLAFGVVDEILCEWCSEQHIVYTRYADDLAFSGKGEIPPGLIEHVTEILGRHGWTLAPDKTRYMRSPKPLMLLGLVVKADTVDLPRAYKHQLRAFEHILKTKRDGLFDSAKLNGHLSYAQSVRSFARLNGN